MTIYLYRKSEFTESDYKTLFGCEWEPGEDDENFLKKAGFSTYNDTFGGFICVYEKREADGFYVSVDTGMSGRAFYAPTFIDLVNLLKFFGMNYFEKRAKVNLFQRTMHVEDLDQEFSDYESVTAIGDNLVFVTSKDPICSE